MRTMFKKKPQIVALSFLLCFLIVFVGTTIAVHGVKIEHTDSLLINKYPIDNYRSYLSSEKGLFGFMNGDKICQALNAIAEILFTITKLVYQIFDFFVKEFYSMDVLGNLSDTVSLLTNNLWNVIKDHYALLIIVISVLMVAKTYFVESPKSAVVQFLKIILVLVVAGIWFPRANQYLSTMNNYSFGFQADIMKVAGQVDATSALSSDGETTTNQATEIMRNELFKQTVYQPFLLLNYGTVNEKEIGKMYAKVDDKNVPKGANAEYLLSKEFSKLKDKEKDAVLKKLSKSNHYLTGDSVGYKFVLALLSVFCLFLYGIPLVFIAFANVLLQILALMWAYILPIVALLSLLPRFSNGLLNSIVGVAKILAAKGLLALAVLMFTLINLTVDLLIKPNSIITVLCNIILKGMIYYFIWKFKGPLFSALTRAVMSRQDAQTVNMRMQQFGHSMNEFTGDARQLAGAFAGGGGVPDGEGEGGGGGGTPPPEDPPFPPYQDPEPEGPLEDDPEETESPKEEETTDATEEIPVEDSELDDPEEIPVEDPELDNPNEIPVEDPELDDPNEIPVEDPQIDEPDNVPVEDPQIDEPDDVEIENPNSTQKNTNDPVESTDNEPNSPHHSTHTADTQDQDIEEQINRQIRIYQNNQDRQNMAPSNEFVQQPNVTVDHEVHQEIRGEEFKALLKELKGK